MKSSFHALALTSVALALGTAPTAAQDGGPLASFALPLSLPERPFMLAQASRRFAPDEDATVDIAHRGPARVTVEIHRVLDPEALLAATTPTDALEVSGTDLGREMERLVAMSGPLPRRGAHLLLLRTTTRALATPAARRHLDREDERQAYDSYELDEAGVETEGVSADDWTEAAVSLGALPAGLYVARATEAAWASSTLVSVGSLALLVRRGDDHDEVRVLDPEGAPLAGIAVRAQVGARTLATGTTDAGGRVILAASTEPSVRYVAIRGDDVAWADASHAPMSTCDARVYLGVGRPVFRYGETMHVRGHVRACDGTGREGPLANEAVEVSGRWVRTDANGDFVAEATATGTLTASVRGHSSSRDVDIDSRRLPDHTLVVRPDRDAVASGERFTVQVSDEDGAWPTLGTVTLTVGDVVQRLPVGPGRPAVFSLTAPRTDAVLDRLTMRAVLESAGQLVFASGEVWTGARDEVLELDVDRALARTGEPIALSATARDLGGAPRAGVPITFEVFPSDGNRPTSMTPVASATLSSSASGAAETSLALQGAGPWWVRARAGLAAMGLAVRSRETPPPLSDRDDVSVRLPADTIAPGRALEVHAFGRGGGSVWITLEQGSVWASELVPLVGERARASLVVPERARGLATVVVSQIHGGRVRSASRTVEVRTSEPITLTVDPDTRTAQASQSLHVTLHARDALGAPADAVVSVWMANAGYWDLGDERYPSPAEVFRLPGRPASGADGSAPVAFGAEEGRQPSSHLTWNGTPMPQSSFRHAWAYGGALVSFDTTGSIGRGVRALAREAGLRGASFCRETEAELEPVALSVASLPWDLVALRIAERVELEVSVEDGVLTFPCPGGGGFGSGQGAGIGARSYGVPHVRSGAASIGVDERELLEGDLFFEGRITLGPDGVAELDIPMPAHPGRFRIEALAIGADGGGERAHAVVHTTGAATVRIELPNRLRVSDVVRGAIEVSVPGAPGQSASLHVTLPTGLVSEAALPSTVLLDAEGRGRVPLVLTAASEGDRLLRVEASVGAASDRVSAALEVLAPPTDRPISFRALVGEPATIVTLALPPRARDASLRVRIDADAERAIESALSELGTPRWGWAPLRVDRLEALVALRRAAARVDGAHARELERSVAGAIAEVIALLADDGSLAARGEAPFDPSLLASLVVAAESGDDDVDDARATLRRRAQHDEVPAHAAPLVALALARTDPTLARALLASAAPRDIDGWSVGLRAAHALGDARLVTRFDRRLVREMARERSALGAGASCRGPVWFACFARRGTRARLARAAEARVMTARPDAAVDAAEVAHAIEMAPAEQSELVWGHADADVIALVSSLATRGASARGVLYVGERVLAHVDGEAWVSIPEGDAPVTLRMSAAPARLTFVRVDGVVAVRPEELPPGEVPVTRRLTTTATGAVFEIAITTAAHEDDATLVVPLPAGLDLALASGVTATMRSAGRPAFSWSPADPRPAAEAPEITVSLDGIHVHFHALERGTTRIELPVAPIARGHFTAGPATLVTASGSFGSTPAMVVDL